MYIEINITVQNDRYSHKSKIIAKRHAELDLPDVTKLDIPMLATELAREAVESYHNGGDRQDDKTEA